MHTVFTYTTNTFSETPGAVPGLPNSVTVEGQDWTLTGYVR